MGESCTILDQPSFEDLEFVIIFVWLMMFRRHRRRRRRRCRCVAMAIAGNVVAAGLVITHHIIIQRRDVVEVVGRW